MLTLNKKQNISFIFYSYMTSTILAKGFKLNFNKNLRTLFPYF